MVWYSHFFKSFPEFVLIHTVIGVSIVNEAERKWKLLSPVRLFATPIDYTVHRILQPTILEWVVVPFFRRSL